MRVRLLLQYHSKILGVIAGTTNRIRYHSDTYQNLIRVASVVSRAFKIKGACMEVLSFGVITVGVILTILFLLLGGESTQASSEDGNNNGYKGEKRNGDKGESTHNRGPDGTPEIAHRKEPSSYGDSPDSGGWSFGSSDPGIGGPDSGGGGDGGD
jgi:hypothetical protein